MTDTRSALQIRRDMIARPKGVTPHICETPDCPYTGKPSPDSCACHLTEIDLLRASGAELQEKYRRVVGTARTLIAWSKTGHGMGIQLQDLERALADLPAPTPPEARAALARATS